MKTNTLHSAALIAATAAVVSLPAAAVETTCVASFGSHCPEQIPDAPQTIPLTSTMTVPQLSCPGGVAPTGVLLRVDITHNWAGDLSLSLTNPNSITAPVQAASPITNDGTDIIQTYSYLSFPTLLGAGTGPWTLTITDTANGNDGALNDWGIDAQCPSSTPAPHDVPALSTAPLAGLGLLLVALGGLVLRRYRGR